MEYFDTFRQSLREIDYYIYALCEIDKEKRTPFYVGKGKGERCLQHLKEAKQSDKTDMIARLFDQGRLGIDILRHGIKENQTAKLIEATCIDLIGKGELTNAVRGHGTDMGRATIEEIHNLVSGEIVEVRPEHPGLAFLLNSTFKSGMSDIELFEATRGVWRNVPRDQSIQFAYATYGGLVKEVYTVHSWVPGGTQQYFTRAFEDDISEKWEFVGRKASDAIREMYIGKAIKKDRSYGNPFVRVGKIK